MSDKIVHLSDNSFDTDVLKAEGPILVDFWAEWCGPCKMIAPILDEIATEYEGKLNISADLPFAQARFCGAEGLENVQNLSTLRGREFIENYGVAIADRFCTFSRPSAPQKRACANGRSAEIGRAHV